jgi:hypothetical protein
MKEWQRTILMLILLGIAIGFIIYVRTGFDHQAIRSLR